MARVRYLSTSEVVELNKEVLGTSDEDPAILSSGNLSMAVDKPTYKIYGVEIHEGLSEKAAALLHELIKLHPFEAGNKRTAYLSADVFLNMNGRKIIADSPEAVEFCIEVGKCTVDIGQATDWIGDHTTGTTYRGRFR